MENISGISGSSRVCLVRGRKKWKGRKWEGVEKIEYV